MQVRYVLISHWCSLESMHELGIACIPGRPRHREHLHLQSICVTVMRYVSLTLDGVYLALLWDRKGYRLLANMVKDIVHTSTRKRVSTCRTAAGHHANGQLAQPLQLPKA